MKMVINLRDMAFAHAKVSDIRHVAMVPEVQRALIAWINAKLATKQHAGVLIGGLAMSFYAKPRYTEDVDLLFLRQSDVPEAVPGFKRTRIGAFQENQTHVEIETVTPESINQSRAIVQKVIETAVEHDGLSVASLAGLVALKLVASDNPKRRMRDLGDVEIMLENNPRPDISDWPLTKDQAAKFEEICKRIYD